MQLDAMGAATARTRPMHTVSDVADAIAGLRDLLEAQGRAVALSISSCKRPLLILLIRD